MLVRSFYQEEGGERRIAFFSLSPYLNERKTMGGDNAGVFVLIGYSYGRRYL